LLIAKPELAPFASDLDEGAPFLKWAGGKTQLLSQLERFLPDDFNAYAEPFVGSGALFFHLRRTRGFFPAILADSNPELVNAYIIVRDKLEQLLPLLEEHQQWHGKEHYYHVRQQKPGELGNVERAARLIYLNKTCFNGLYRVNSEGQFNVPIGSYVKPRIFDEESLRAASDSLQQTTFLQCDFAEIESQVSSADFVYFDPPYYPVSGTASFTGYAMRNPMSQRTRGNVFGVDDQQRLSVTFAKLAARGSSVMLSNSDTRRIRVLYRDFQIEKVKARRAINCDGAKRGVVDEVVILSKR